MSPSRPPVLLDADGLPLLTTNDLPALTTPEDFVVQLNAASQAWFDETHALVDRIRRLDAELDEGQLRLRLLGRH